MKTIYAGLEDSGKSLKLAMTSTDIVDRNKKFFKITGKERALWSNLKYKTDFEKYANDNHVPIHYWKDLEELILLKDCDVVIDEIGKYFDSRFWPDLSLDVRTWLAQASKMGVDMYGSAQDFAQVDKSFRRLVNELYEIEKVVGSPRPTPTRPPVKRIWGLCMVKQLDPRAYVEDNKVVISVIPSPFFIRKKYCDIFDTRQVIGRSKPAPLVHEERYCPDEDCVFHRKPKIAHV